MALEEIKGYMIGVILFIVVVTGGISIFSLFAAQDISIDSGNQIGQFNRTLAKSTEVTLAVTDVENSINRAGSGSGALGWLDALVGSAYNGIKATLVTMGFVSVAANESAAIFSIPIIFVTLITLIITIIIAFAIWSAITKS